MNYTNRVKITELGKVSPRAILFDLIKSRKPEADSDEKLKQMLLQGMRRSNPFLFKTTIVDSKGQERRLTEWSVKFKSELGQAFQHRCIEKGISGSFALECILYFCPHIVSSEEDLSSNSIVGKCWNELYRVGYFDKSSDSILSTVSSLPTSQSENNEDKDNDTFDFGLYLENHTLFEYYDDECSHEFLSSTFLKNWLGLLSAQNKALVRIMRREYGNSSSIETYFAILVDHSLLTIDIFLFLSKEKKSRFSFCDFEKIAKERYQHLPDTPNDLYWDSTQVKKYVEKTIKSPDGIADILATQEKILAIIEEKQKTKPPIFTPASNHYLEWEGLSFRHNTEIELAKELERRGIMFFPSAGVRVTNSLTDERKTLEPDFLILYKGKMGILELDGESHKEKHYSDAQRARIFKKQGISIVEHYPSSMSPEKIVDDFLEIMSAA
jgi:hypothetical protein